MPAAGGPSKVVNGAGGYTHTGRQVESAPLLLCTGCVWLPRRLHVRLPRLLPAALGTAPNGTTRCNIQTNIVHTLATRDNAEGGAIRATVSRIEYHTDKKAQAKWRELYPDTEPAGLFVAKVDVFEIPMGKLQASLPACCWPTATVLTTHRISQGFSTRRHSWTAYALPKDFASKATWPPP